MQEINFYLPDFFYLYDLNMYIIDLLNNKPELFRDNIKIKALYGTFPGAYWNAGRVFHGNADNSNIENTINYINNVNVAVRFTFTNTMITEHLLYDPYCNFIMEKANNGMNEVLVNHPLLEKYLRKTYPNFKYISSTTKCLLDINKINKECEKYDLMVLDYRKNKDKDFHKKLKPKDKIELLLNAYCSPECKQRTKHYEYLSKCQITGEVPKEFCDILKHSFYDMIKLSSTISPDELYDYYINQGFRHFKIEGRTLHIIDAIENYVYYLFKPEYRDIARYNIIKDFWNYQ